MQNPNKRIKETERGRGEGSGLPRRRARHHAGKEKGPAGGELLTGTGHRGAAAKPLDGGALTRWGARTPARGPETAPGLAARSRRRSSSLGDCCGGTEWRGESSEAKERERARRPNGARVQGRRGGRRFLILRCARAAVGWRRTTTSEWAK